MYASVNFKTKKAFKEAIERGDKVEITPTGPFPAPTNGKSTIEGPWYPRPHSWYADVEIVDGLVVKVK